MSYCSFPLALWSAHSFYLGIVLRRKHKSGGRVFKGPVTWVSWGNLRTGRCCCCLSGGQCRSWRMCLFLGKWTQMKRCMWYLPGCRSLQVCTRAQSHCYWWMCEEPPSLVWCKESCSGPPLAQSERSASQSLQEGPEIPPRQSSRALSFWQWYLRRLPCREWAHCWKR